MGILLQQKIGRKKITPNPTVDSINIVYTPAGESDSNDDMVLKDPSGLSIRFQSVEDFMREQKK